MRKYWILVLIAIFSPTALGGCSLPDPYIYKYREFDRTLKDFGKDEPNRKVVSICYNKKNTTPQHIVDMAKAECAKYHKVARFSAQKYLVCPILTPVEAIFLCETQQGLNGTSSSFLY